MIRLGKGNNKRNQGPPQKQLRKQDQIKSKRTQQSQIFALSQLTLLSRLDKYQDQPTNLTQNQRFNVEDFIVQKQNLLMQQKQVSTTKQTANTKISKEEILKLSKLRNKKLTQQNKLVKIVNKKLNSNIFELRNYADSLQKELQQLQIQKQNCKLLLSFKPQNYQQNSIETSQQREKGPLSQRNESLNFSFIDKDICYSCQKVNFKLKKIISQVHSLEDSTELKKAMQYSRTMQYPKTIQHLE